MKLENALCKGVLLGDGAMGTMLQAEGVLGGGLPPDMVNLIEPDVVQGIHVAYASAGADVLTTNTFGANPIKLSSYDLSDRMEEINRVAVELAAAAGEDRLLLAGSMGPTGGMLEPYGNLIRQDVVECFASQAAVLRAAGVDLLLLETFMDLSELTAAVEGAIQGAPDLPVAATMSFGTGGRTIMGVKPSEAVGRLADKGLSFIGANCGTGPQEMLPVIEAMAAGTAIPIIAQPNAGRPVLHRGKTIYEMTPTDMAVGLKRLLDAGAVWVGGCCGSTPGHVAAFAGLVAEGR